MPDVMIDTIRTIDDIFLQMAEADGRELPLDAAVEAMWTALVVNLNARQQTGE